MRPARMRLVLLALAAGGVAGMIATSIADSVQGAQVFGLLTAAPTLALLCVTAVTDGGVAVPDEDLAEDLEVAAEALIADGADPALVQELTRAAVRLGRRHSP